EGAHLPGQVAVGEPEQRPSPVRLEHDLDCARSRWNGQNPVLPSPCEHELAVRDDLQYLAADTLVPVQVDAVDAPRAGIEARLNTHPAHHPLGLDQEAEDGRRRRVDPYLALNRLSERLRRHHRSPAPPPPHA